MQARSLVGTVCGIMMGLGLTTAAHAGARVNIDEQTWLEAGFLGQIHATHTDDATPEDDIFLRRGRIILSGQVRDGVKFFAETDNDNAGKNGAPDASTDIQDAFVDIRLPGSTRHWFKAGLILLPFSFETRASAASLLGNDYNSEAVKLVNTFVWRDYGAELHGDFADSRISYAAGIFDGYDSETTTKNDDADLRATGHVAVNLIGKAETGWFYTQNRLGKAGNYLSLGAGADTQEKASRIEPAIPADGSAATDPARVVDSENWVLDVQSGYDLGTCGLTLNAAWYNWENSVFEGETAFVEGGVLVQKVMLTGKYSTQEPDGRDSASDTTVGLHYFDKGHNLRGGIEYRTGDSADQVLVGIQFLL